MKEVYKTEKQLLSVKDNLTELTKNLDESGFYIWRELLNKDEVDGLLKACDEIVECQAEYSKHRSERYASNLHPKFAGFVIHPIIIKAAKHVLKTDDISYLEDILFFKPPGSAGMAAHQENFYHAVQKMETITIWTAIDNADKENGCLWTAPGSHAESVLPVDYNENNAILDDNPSGGLQKNRSLTCRFPGKYPKVWITAKAGDTIFVHNHLVHGSEENYSKDRFRRARSCVFMKRGVSFNPGETGKRRELPLSYFAEYLHAESLSSSRKYRSPPFNKSGN